MLIFSHFGKIYWLPSGQVNSVEKTPPDPSSVLLSRNATIDGKDKTIYGTGTFVAKNMILTAAHVVKDVNAKSDKTLEWTIRTNWNQPIDSDKLDNQKTHKYSANANLVDIHVHYYGDVPNKTYGFSSVAKDDLALIILPETFDATQLDATISPIAYNPDPKLISYTGYPFENFPKSKKGTAYKSVGKPEWTLLNNQNVMVVNSQTFKGMSGSGAKDENNNVVGVLSMFVYMEPFVPEYKKTSAIVHFTQDQVDWINDQINIYGNS